MDSQLAISLMFIFLSAMLQSTTGFGFALLSVPALSLVYGPHVAVPLIMIVSYVTILLNVKKVYQEREKGTVKKLFIGSLFGVPIGLLIFLYANVDLLKLFFGLITLLISSLFLFKDYFINLIKNIKQGEYISGAISGIMTTSVGMPGPAVMLFLESKKQEQGPYRATGLVYLFLVYPIPILSFLLAGLINLFIIKLALLLIPISILGMITGNYIHNRISKRVFSTLTYSILLSTGLIIFATTLF
ncbi:sulfite exporter TauE/SafE family protein [Alkalihalophilus marmarensis]|uniref:sulfite exporter TauE/SafE family protein n=1 Tax=Alkalihalophilus marmarensis TaxID=521377 RepID=UPI002DB6335E|nr:sulfite exporter TauE/SafE family protein [Alkalihalophilus marmarensis]MEC2074132.1 sulfite exporter TauE/SafE family protein [Alkalihalophilus marmarensis]